MQLDNKIQLNYPLQVTTPSYKTTFSLQKGLALLKRAYYTANLQRKNVIFTDIFTALSSQT